MKSIYKISALVLCLMATTISHAQCFQKKSMFLDLGIGIAIYNTEVYNYENDSTKTGKAGSVIIPLTFEYGVGNRIGVGLQLVRQNFIAGKDSTNNTKPDAHSGEINLLGNYHFYRSDHTDLYGGITLGISGFKYNSNNANKAILDAGGSFTDLHFGARFLFGNHTGMLLNLSFPTMNYIQGLASDNQGNEVNFDLKFSGFTIGTGLTYKF